MNVYKDGLGRHKNQSLETPLFNHLPCDLTTVITRDLSLYDVS